MILAFHKPYGVLSQFTEEIPGQKTLALFGFPKGVYPMGRLDADSEGLLLLSDEKSLVDRLLNPKFRHPRTYWAQVEGIPDGKALSAWRRGGIIIKGYRTEPCYADVLEPRPHIPNRVPPIRYRAQVPDTWVELELIEGKNRQVRRMTAAVGFPTLRLIRVAVGQFVLGNLPVGEWRELSFEERKLVLG